MNEKLVSWFEDLLPEIKESGDVDSTLLKFANEKNLSPALLEKIGHVYNTAKTVNYLDKAEDAGKSRGDSFQILDVSNLVDKYTEKTASDHDYSDNDFSSLSSSKFPDLFDDPKKIDLENLEEGGDSYEYHEIKLAEDKHSAFHKQAVDQTNGELTEQLIFDLVEDNREYAQSLSDSLRNPINEYSFEQLEKDATHYFGDSIKGACDYFHTYLSEIGMHEKRAFDSGESRLIKDTSYISKLAEIQDNLNTISMAEDLKKNFLTKAGKTKTRSPRVSPRPRDSGDTPSYDDMTELERSTNQTLDAGANLADVGLQTGKDVIKGTVDVVRGLPDTYGKVTKQRDDFLESVFKGDTNKKQKIVDDDEADARYETLIQDLLITDPILMEADEDQVLDIYNTIKGVAPELAKDKNVMRVALRSAIQHEGIGPFDLQQFMEAEKNLQKVHNNIRYTDELDYNINKKPDIRMSP